MFCYFQYNKLWTRARILVRVNGHRHSTRLTFSTFNHFYSQHNKASSVLEMNVPESWSVHDIIAMHPVFRHKLLEWQKSISTILLASRSLFGCQFTSSGFEVFFGTILILGIPYLQRNSIQLGQSHVYSSHKERRGGRNKIIEYRYRRKWMRWKANECRQEMIRFGMF